jgi:hypothetical protein
MSSTSWLTWRMALGKLPGEVWMANACVQLSATKRTPHSLIHALLKFVALSSAASSDKFKHMLATVRNAVAPSLQVQWQERQTPLRAHARGMNNKF